MQFGADSKLAAQCVLAPTPDGWRVWSPGSDGPIPDALAKRAAALTDDQSVPLGTTESFPLPGVVTMIRVEPHVWGRDDKGNLVQGCFRATEIYLPAESGMGAGVRPPQVDGWSRAATILTVTSLSVGTVATVASLRRKS